MGLGTGCKGEPSRMKDVPIESPGREEIVFRCKKIPLIIIIIIIL
jgi:hypothetical protein